jgi:hypothetical protein
MADTGICGFGFSLPSLFLTYFLVEDADHFHVLYWYKFTLGTNQNQ